MSKFRLKEKAIAVDKAFKEAIQIVAKDAVITFRKNFSKEGFADDVFQPWQARKKETRKSRGKKILTNSGRLRRSIRYASRIGGYSALVFTDVPYAEIHNEGGKLNRKGGTREVFRGDTMKVGSGRFSIKTRKEGTKTLKINTIESYRGKRWWQRSDRMPKRQFRE